MGAILFSYKRIFSYGYIHKSAVGQFSICAELFHEGQGQRKDRVREIPSRRKAGFGAFRRLGNSPVDAGSRGCIIYAHVRAFVDWECRLGFVFRFFSHLVPTATVPKSSLGTPNIIDFISRCMAPSPQLWPKPIGFGPNCMGGRCGSPLFI